MFTTGETVGPAEWIIDDTCLVCYLFVKAWQNKTFHCVRAEMNFRIIEWKASAMKRKLSFLKNPSTLLLILLSAFVEQGKSLRENKNGWRWPYFIEPL